MSTSAKLTAGWPHLLPLSPFFLDWISCFFVCLTILYFMMNIVYKRLERLKFLLFLLQRGSVSRWSEGRVISTQPGKVFGAGLHLLLDSIHLWSQPSWGWDLTVFVVDSTLSHTMRDSWGFYFALQFSSLFGHFLQCWLRLASLCLFHPENHAFWRFREFRSLASLGKCFETNTTFIYGQSWLGP